MKVSAPIFGKPQGVEKLDLGTRLLFCLEKSQQVVCFPLYEHSELQFLDTTKKGLKLVRTSPNLLYI